MLDNWDALAAGLATYVREFLPHQRRRALPVRLPAAAGQVVGVFGNDGYATDDRVKKEVDVLRQRLREDSHEEVGFGLSEDGHAWARVVGPSPRPAFGGASGAALAAGLDDAIWEAWRVAFGHPLSGVSAADQ